MAVLEGRMGDILSCNSNFGDCCRRVIFRDLSIKAWMDPIDELVSMAAFSPEQGAGMMVGASGCWSAYLVKCTRTTREEEESWSLGS